MAISRGRKIFGLIARELPGTALCKDMLVVAPTEHVLRGFLLEATTEKNMVYLWRVITPLHRPMRHPFLNYSNRIFGGEKVFIDPRAYRRSADIVRSIIAEHVPYLQAIRGHADFLRHIAWMMKNDSFHFRYDLALTYCRIGKVDEARAIFRSLAADLDEPEERQREAMFPRLKQFNDEVRHAAHSAETSPMELTTLIDAWETQNIETLDLRPTLVSTDIAGKAAS
jgi:hypothetical protein